MDTHDRITVIEPQKYGIFPDLKQLWEYRHLISYFSMRYVKRRYQSTVLGWPWLILRPLISAIIFTVVFHNIANISSGEVPYMLFFLCGICLWDFLEISILFATRSLRADRRLITKLYFPRIIIPLASIAPPLVELVVYGGLIITVTLYYYVTTAVFYLDIRPASIIAILFILLTMMLCLGIGFFSSVLNAQARDVRFSLPYVMRIWMFITPVVYPLSSVPQSYRWITALNPMTSIIEGFKWCLLGNGEISIAGCLFSAIVIICVFLAGAWFFNKYESSSVDRL